MTTAVFTAGAAGGLPVTSASNQPNTSTQTEEMTASTTLFVRTVRDPCVVTTKMIISATPWDRTTQWRLSTPTEIGPQSWLVWWILTTNQRPPTGKMDQWESPPIPWIMSITCKTLTSTRSDAFLMGQTKIELCQTWTIGDVTKVEGVSQLPTAMLKLSLWYSY